MLFPLVVKQCSKLHLLNFLQVRLFNLSRCSGRGLDDNAIAPSALFQCHSRRVKKLAVRYNHVNNLYTPSALLLTSSTCFFLQVEVGNPHVVWSASEDGTLRQHDFREGDSCPPAGSSHQECRNVLVSIML